VLLKKEGLIKNKQLHKSERSDVHNMLLKWSKQKGSENIPVRSPLFMTNVEDLAKLLNNKQFMCPTR
jgi:hypothetical protein